MLRAIARLSADRKRIEVAFPYSPSGLAAIRAIPGRRWSASKRVWTVPLDLTSGRRLREEFGAGLAIDSALRRWGRAEKRKAAARKALSQAATAEPTLLPSLLPELYEMTAGRPYQRADIVRLADDHALLGNEPGTGKSIEIIGAAAEADLLDRPMLIVAPVRSIENTWAVEFAKAGYPHPVYASEEARERKGWINWSWMEWSAGRRSFALVINPDLLRLKPAKGDDWVVARDPVSGDPYAAPNQWAENLFEIDWGLVAIDEFHLFGLTNPRSQFGLAVRLLRAERRILSSGTPMGGKYKRLWAALNWLHPDLYGSWWRWAGQWLVIEDNGFGKVVRDALQPGREKEFRDAHAHHFIRRTKLKDLPGCPPKIHRLVLTPMTRYQEKQYREFERDAEIRIAGRRISGKGILSEWSRLRSFANAAARVERGKLRATADSGKLPYLLDALAESGIRRRDPEPGARALVGSVDKSFVGIVAEFLRANGIEADTLTGDTKDSKPLISRFQGDDRTPYVIVMTVQTGGVSLNLERANAIHALDESWNPDDTSQYFDRGDRGSRKTPLLCVTYRTPGTIQEYVAKVAAGKEINNRNVHEYVDRVRKLSTP